MVDRRQVQIARQATLSPFPSSTTTTTSIPPPSTSFSSTLLHPSAPSTLLSPSTSSTAVDTGISPNDGYSIAAVSTNAAGSVVYTTVTVTVPSTTAISVQLSSSSSTPIAAIIGGVVGGVVVLVVIALLIYFIWRRSSKNESDGDYEPDRIINRPGGGGTLPQLDLSDEANNIIPFNAYAADGDEEKQQYGQSPFSSGPLLVGVTGTQAKHQIPDSDGQFYLQSASSGHLPRQSLLAGPPQGAALPAGQYARLKQLFMYDAAPADWYTRLGSSLSPSTVPSASASLGSTKEPEAAGERDVYGSGLAPQCEPLERSESPLGPAGGRVVVHRDAGRAPEEDFPHEIPPAYDSIQH